jgi:hypothetical protein
LALVMQPAKHCRQATPALRAMPLHRQGWVLLRRQGWVALQRQGWVLLQRQGLVALQRPRARADRSSLKLAAPSGVFLAWKQRRRQHHEAWLKTPSLRG